MRSAWIAAGLLGFGIVALTCPGRSRAETRHAKPGSATELHVLRPVSEQVGPPPTEAEAREAQLLALTDDPVFGRAELVHGSESKNVVAFTFDDGPNPDTTPRVLRALAKYDVPATFFIVTKNLDGAHAKRARAVLQQQIAGGYTIGSHTQHHARLELATSSKVLNDEIDDSIFKLAPEVGRVIGLFRPPYGKLSYKGQRRLAKLGLTEVRWSIDPRDWEAKDGPLLRKTIVSGILQNAGGIVLLHDVKALTAEVIGHVFDDLEKENCRRLQRGRTPIIPVSLHYFLRETKDGLPRPVPETVQARTDAYRAALPDRCQRRLRPRRR